jgi:hypothetical protein
MDSDQMSSLAAAAKAALPPDQFEIFAAIMSAVDRVQNERNRLAHWVWGTCPELPDRLLLANPEILKVQKIRVKEHTTKVMKQTTRLREHAEGAKKGWADRPARELAELLISIGEDLALDFALMVEESTNDMS